MANNTTFYPQLFQAQLQHYQDIPRKYDNTIVKILTVVLAGIGFVGLAGVVWSGLGTLLFDATSPRVGQGWYMVTFFSIGLAVILWMHLRGRDKQLREQWVLRAPELQRELLDMVKNGLHERYDVQRITLVPYPEQWLDLLYQPRGTQFVPKAEVVTQDRHLLTFRVFVGDTGVRLMRDSVVSLGVPDVAPETLEWKKY